MAKIKKRNHRKLPKLASLTQEDQDALNKHLELVLDELRDDLNAVNREQNATLGK